MVASQLKGADITTTPPPPRPADRADMSALQGARVAGRDSTPARVGRRHRVTVDPRGWGLERSTDDRMIAGVAAGVAARLGVDPGIIRLAFVVLATAGGAGLVAYGVGAAVLPDAEDDLRPMRPPTARRAAGVAFIVAGLLFLLRAVGIWFADSLTWSVGLAAAGSAVVWTRAAASERERWRAALQQAVGTRTLPDLASLSRIRLAVGAILLLAGLVTVAINIDLSAAPDVLLAALVTAVGIALVLGPWLQTLAAQVNQERRERIRADERADMAAHLHDSVLQTLALIQRADTPEEMARLARGQERELRSWLFGRRPDDAPNRLGEAIRDQAGAVEDRYGVQVEVVLAGDTDLDPHLEAMVSAAAEALTNAGKHAGVGRIDVFVEVDDDAVSIFVRDEGVGFDPEGILGDRRGVRDSIRGRMQRHGGSAHVHSVLGEGTEVELVLPRTPQTADADPDR